MLLTNKKRVWSTNRCVRVGVLPKSNEELIYQLKRIFILSEWCEELIRHKVVCTRTRARDLVVTETTLGKLCKNVLNRSYATPLSWREMLEYVENEHGLLSCSQETVFCTSLQWASYYDKPFLFGMEPIRFEDSLPCVFRTEKRNGSPMLTAQVCDPANVFLLANTPLLFVVNS